MSRWATQHARRLRAGETISFRPVGNSMQPIIESKQLCTLAPVPATCHGLKVGDVVLCRVRDDHYLHKITRIDGTMFEIGNNKGRINGSIGIGNIFGRLVSVSP